MSILLLISLALRLGAFFWCLLIWYRVRDWRISLLVLGIGLGNGRLFWVAAQPESWPVTLDSPGPAVLSIILSLLSFVVVAVVARTITQYKAAMASLKKSEEKFLKAFRASPDAMTISRMKDGTFIDVNEGFERISGYSREEAIGKSSLELELWAVVEDRDRMIAELNEKGRTPAFEIPIRTKSGEIITCQATAEVFTLDGEPHLVAITRDVTDQKRLQRQLLEASDREQRRLAHDLHDSVAQDLVGISLLVKFLDDALRSDSTDLSGELDSLQDMVRQAISNTRSIAQGVAPIDLMQGGLETALTRLCASMTELFGTPCHLKYSPGVDLTDEGVAIHLYRIAQEALSNAIHHSNCKAVHISVEQGAEGLILAVSDNGKGLPGATVGSDGMGMHIMEYRASMIGGSVAFESERDRGTTVRCTVPLAALTNDVQARAGQKPGYSSVVV